MLLYDVVEIEVMVVELDVVDVVDEILHLID